MPPFAVWRRRAALAFLALVGALSVPLRDAAAEPPLPVRDTARALRSAIAAPDVRAYLGVVVESSVSGVRVVRVVPGSPADEAGLRAGDLLTSMDGTPLYAGADLDRTLAARGPGDVARVSARRSGTELAVAPRLSGKHADTGLFRGGVFRLAVVPIRFTDDTDLPPDASALRTLLFARTGRTGDGASLADYYRDQSYGRLSVEGDVLAPVAVGGPRGAFARRPMGGGEGSVFQAAAAALAARSGDASLDAYDGITFLYSGAAETRSGFALWPHRATVLAGARRLPYYVHPASGGSAGDAAAIGIHCHEFGHLLGLPDTYGTGHRTGCGDFCLMAIGHRGAGPTGERSPFSMCAHCRLRMGWLDAPVVDPRTAQRLRLRPVGSGPSEGVIVPLDPRCDEYVLLEVRARRGFDAALPSEGLLVWHSGGRPTPGQSVYAQPVDLVEAHGIDVFDASLVRTSEIAFPTARCRDLTPETSPRIPVPASGFRLDLTDIVREPDGSVVFTLGVKKDVRQAAPVPAPREVVDAGGSVVRRDPVTGEDVHFWIGPAGRPGAGDADTAGRR